MNVSLNVSFATFLANREPLVLTFYRGCPEIHVLYGARLHTAADLNLQNEMVNYDVSRNDMLVFMRFSGLQCDRRGDGGV